MFTTKPCFNLRHRVEVIFTLCSTKRRTLNRSAYSEQSYARSGCKLFFGFLYMFGSVAKVAAKADITYYHF